MRRVIVTGGGGRELHDFDVVLRGDPAVHVVAFTADPATDDRPDRYPAALAGPRYPNGIPIRPESDLAALVESERADEVVLSSSGLSHEAVMHRASAALAAGADVRLLGPGSTMLESARPVVAVCAVRTGSGKSQTSRRVAEILRDARLRVAIVRRPTPRGDLAAMRVQRFATLADIDATDPTLHEREELEGPVAQGFVVHAGLDSAAVLHAAEAEADVIVWDGGGNDLPVVCPDLLITVVDPLRAGHELRYHPGETNLRLADVVLVNKVDSADATSVERVLVDVATLNPTATVVRAASPVTLEPGPPLASAAVLVVEDGTSVTEGGMPFGAGTVAAEQAGARLRVDPRPYAVGSIARAFQRYPHLGSVLPALGSSTAQLRELAETLDRAECDVVVSGTPVDLRRLVECRHPIRHATYELAELGSPTLADVLAPLVERVRAGALAPAG